VGLAAQQQGVAGQVGQARLGAVVDRAGLDHGAHGNQRHFVAFHQVDLEAVLQRNGIEFRQAEFGGVGMQRWPPARRR
jgi:hypothetical protein